MNAEQKGLYERICEFEFDDQPSARSFAARLAAEQGWSPDFAARAIDEYRRFVFLAMTAGHPVCPSEAVDEVWHLHLIYTRSYWQRFCGQVLGRPLHHDPSRGGPDESAKHHRMYADTLAAYRQAFGQEPPAEFWPDVAARFRSPKGGQRLSEPRFAWRPRRMPEIVRQFLWAGAIVTLPALVGPPLLGMTDPYDMRGPAFLKLFTVVAVAVLGMGLVTRWLVRHLSVLAPGLTPALDGYELAYLAGGAGRAINVAVVRLMRAGSLEAVTHNPPSFRRVSAAPAGSTALERQVCEAFPADGLGGMLRAAHRQTRGSFGPMVEKLRDCGLLVSRAGVAIGSGLPLVVMAAVLLFGVGKIAVGIERHRPVALLVIECLVTLLVSLIVFVRPLFRTPAGDALLTERRDDLENLHAQARHDHASLAPDNLTMVLGLWGCGMLLSSPYDELGRREGWAGWYSGGCGTYSGVGGGGGCGAAGGGGGCGGGGGGGGCGGGGCGGCGG